METDSWEIMFSKQEKYYLHIGVTAQLILIQVGSNNTLIPSTLWVRGEFLQSKELQIVISNCKPIMTGRNWILE